jgi:predicted nucleic acid-binding protein
MKSKVFIDTGIFMYARGKDHPLKTPCSQVILKIARENEIGHYGAPVINTEVFQEIIYRYAMIDNWDTGISVCRDIKALEMDILSVTGSDMERLLELAEKYKKKNIPPRDLIHAAVMINNGVYRIITADKHFDSIKEITRISPEKIR